MNKKEKIYFLPSTIKIRKGETPPDMYLSGENRIFAVRNEIVDAQVVLSGFDGEVVNAEISDLVGNDTKIGAGCIDLYAEHYTHCRAYADGPILFPENDVSDMLIPLHLAKEEDRSVQSGKNFAIWISIHVPKTARNGCYSGNIRISIGGEKKDVKYKLKVYDYILPDRFFTASCFYLRYELLKNGEGYCDQALREKYYEFLLEHRLLGFFLPAKEFTPVAYADAVEKYFDDERVMCYGLPTVFTGEVDRKMFDELQEYVLELARRSTPERNYLERAYTYFYDEPELGRMIEIAKGKLRIYHEILEKAADIIENSGEYRSFKLIQNWRKYITGLKTIGTIDIACLDADLLEQTEIWCPSYVSYASSESREKGAALAERLDAELWWYGCMGPPYPYPTYHIRDCALSPRLVSWQQKKYNIKGNLYWSVAHYEHKDMNYYTMTSLQPFFPEGEGMLMYPAKGYGADSPLPSVRLMNIRAGMQDYALLLAAENKFGKAYIDRLCEGLFCEMIPFDDPAAFESAREKLLGDLEKGADCELLHRGYHEKFIESGIFKQIETDAEITLIRENYGRLLALPQERGIEVQLVAKEDGTASISWPINIFTVENGLPDRIGWYVHNAESRSLTTYIYAKNGEEEEIIYGIEFFADTCCYVNIELRRFAEKYGKFPDRIEFKIRNTFREDKAKTIRLFMNSVKITYLKT